MFATPEFWVAAAFILVVGFLFKPVARILTGALDARAAKIRTQIEEARRLREDAQAVLAEYQRKQRDAMAEAEKIIAGAKETAARTGRRPAACKTQSRRADWRRFISTSCQDRIQCRAMGRGRCVTIASAIERLSGLHEDREFALLFG